MSGVFNASIFNNAIFNTEEVAALEWPAAVIPYNFDLFLRQNTATFVSPISRKSQVLTRQGGLWQGKASVIVDREDSQSFDAFLDSLEGPAQSFLLWDFSRPEPIGANEAAGDVTVLASASAGDMSFTTEGWNVGVSGQLLAGDQIGVDGYLYRLSQDADSNGSGHATLQLTFPLQSDLSVGMVVTRTKPTVSVRLGQVDTMKSILSNYYEISFEEAW